MELLIERARRFRSYLLEYDPRIDVHIGPTMPHGVWQRVNFKQQKSANYYDVAIQFRYSSCEFNIAEPCTHLWCEKDKSKMCKTKKGPPLEGTECGFQKVILSRLDVFWNVYVFSGALTNIAKTSTWTG